MHAHVQVRSGDRGEDIPGAWLVAAGGLLHGKELGQLQGQESGPPSELGIHMMGSTGKNQSIVFMQGCGLAADAPHSLRRSPDPISAPTLGTPASASAESPPARSLGFEGEIIYKLAVYSTFRASQGKA